MPPLWASGGGVRMPGARDGSVGAMPPTDPALVHAEIPSPLGPLTLVADTSPALTFDTAREPGALTGVYLANQAHRPAADALGPAVSLADVPVLEQASVQLTEFFDATRRCFDLPLAPVGSEFSQRTWALLREIPYGQTTTYGALAAQLGNKNLARRVGQVVGRNPISIIVPCHRVVAANGALTGYAGGLDNKKWLLDFEAVTRPANSSIGPAPRRCSP